MTRIDSVWLATEPEDIVKAMDYSLKRWGTLLRYIEDGAVTIDNNTVGN